MKARGRYLLGIDFDTKDEAGRPTVLAVPMRGPSPLWHQAETVTTDQIERMVDALRQKHRSAEARPE